ncbi:MAG: DUF2254 domain-containing protein [Candidatus Methanoperedens sp.]|nr:DUF2254 domain-containing protein [Candidatus Methanoperedens sp.]
MAKIDFLKSLVKNIRFCLKSSIVILGELFGLCKIYLILLAIVMIAFPIIFYYFGSPGIDLDLLRILVESEVAMFAIVISLSLVAVELAASSYSVRVINLFKNTPDFWFILETYIGAIIFGLILLKLIKNNDLSNFYPYILSAYFYLSIFAFLALVPYVWNTLNILKPSTMIKMLAEKINKQNILSAYEKTHSFSWGNIPGNDNDKLRSFLRKYFEGINWVGNANIIKIDNDRIIRVFTEEKSIEIILDRNYLTTAEISYDDQQYYLHIEKENDDFKISYQNSEKISDKEPIQPIIDIVCGSMLKYDYETVKIGLRAIGENSNHIFENEDLNDGEEEKISRLLFDHMKRVGILAANTKDEDSAIEVIVNISENGITGAKKFKSMTWLAVDTLRRVGGVAAENKLEDATKKVLSKLGFVGREAAKNKYGGAALWAVVSSSEIGKMAIKQNLEYAAKTAYLSFKWIGVVTAEQPELEYITEQVAESIGEVGIASVNQKMKKAAEQAAESLGEVGIAATNNNQFNATRQVVKSLENLGLSTSEHEFKDAAWESVFSLRKIVEITIEKVNDDLTRQIAKSLGEVGDAAAEHELRIASLLAVDYIRWVGLKTAQKEKLNEALWQAIESLEKVGIAVCNQKELEYIGDYAISYLGDIQKRVKQSNAEISKQIEDSIKKIEDAKQKSEKNKISKSSPKRSFRS